MPGRLLAAPSSSCKSSGVSCRLPRLPMPVVDASVCVALFKADEPGHQAARAWLTESLGTGEPIVSPAILLPEVAAALARGLAMGSAAVSEAVDLRRRRSLVELFPGTEAP